MNLSGVVALGAVGAFQMSDRVHCRVTSLLYSAEKRFARFRHFAMRMPCLEFQRVLIFSVFDLGGILNLRLQSSQVRVPDGLSAVGFVADTTGAGTERPVSEGHCKRRFARSAIDSCVC